MKNIISKSLITVLLVSAFWGCSKKPGDVIRDFYGAESWEEKKQFIFDAELIKPNEVYNEIATYDIEEISAVKTISKDSIIYKAKIIQKIDDAETTKLIHFLVINTPKGEKIDFNAKLKKNKYSISEYATQKSDTRMYYWTTIQVGGVVFERHVGGKAMAVEGNVLTTCKDLGNSPDAFTVIYNWLHSNNASIDCLLEITRVDLSLNRETGTAVYIAVLKAPKIISFDIFYDFEDK